MDTENPKKKSQLLTILHEGVGLVQMILFKELRTLLGKKYSGRDNIYLSMLAGAITNEVFGSQNPEQKFKTFLQENNALIEQELLSLAHELPDLRSNITDALRIQTLCDSQMGNDNTSNLTKADALGLLVTEREIPLPSTFMTMVRRLGEQHGLIIPPIMITPEEDKSVLH
jgi:hypothetical protein